MCLFIILVALSPRLALAVMWLFTNLVDRAFGGWIWPLLGFLFVPWTTLIYVIVWSPGGASGIDWLWIALGALADAATYSARAARRRRRAYE